MHNIPLYVAIPSHKYRMRFIAAKILLVEESELTLEPMPLPKQAQESTIEWIKARNRTEQIKENNK